MKKVQYSYLPAEATSPETPGKNKSTQKLTTSRKEVTPPTEEMVAKLNAMSREYPFCAYIKQRGSSML